MSKTIFVGNLAWTTTAENLKSVVESLVGHPVQKVDVQLHTDTGRSKGWGLVNFETREGTLKAIEVLNGQEVEGRPLYVREDRTEIEKEEGFVVFVGNLPWDMTAEKLRKVFSMYDPYDVHIKTNMSGRSRGFGLLRFRTAEEAQNVIEKTHGSSIGERKILVRLDRAHLEMMGKATANLEISETVTCGNIPWHTGDEVLACHMAQAGRLVSCQIQRHADTLRSKGWAIIRYLTPDEGANAVRSLHRTVLDGRTLNVRFYKPAAKNSPTFQSSPYGQPHDGMHSAGHHQHQQQGQHLSPPPRQMPPQVGMMHGRGGGGVGMPPPHMGGYHHHMHGQFQHAM